MSPDPKSGGLDYGTNEKGARTRNPSAVSRNPNAGNFIPLRDLLQRNHNDRVQDYLEKMGQTNPDDLMNTNKDATAGMQMGAGMSEKKNMKK
jgi:hypothetical protein